MPDEVHKARSKDYRERQWSNWFEQRPAGEILIVLTDDETVVGFALSKPNNDSDIDAAGEMHAGYILPDYRGGISGPALMKALAERMQSLGQWPACIWAFKENPHRRFYTALGWHPVVERDRVIAGAAIPEVGYTSPDYSDLSGRLDRMLASAVQRQTRQPSQPTADRAHLAS
ncbi:GNAT family N-acetyltransferase [uncultured Roseibium sp.]|uniref:GNAT family N-acetyltransferase n=1 Tax=uncultured Roseibium sp. TaxID=1936171 RepID=UPI00344C544F